VIRRAADHSTSDIRTSEWLWRQRPERPIGGGHQRRRHMVFHTRDQRSYDRPV